jgi:protoporphyrinogen oxidase
MGLAAAFHAVKAGHTVEVLEAAPEPGGMAAHFDLAELSIERFYHFVCKSDTPTMELMDELGIRDQMRWRTTSMGIFTGGKLHSWGTPVALMNFSEISLISRLRYGLFAFVSVRRDRWMPSRLNRHGRGSHDGVEPRSTTGFGSPCWR